MSQLFRDSPAEFERRIERLLTHFRHAEYVFYAGKQRGIPGPRDLLWLLIQEAVQTARSMPDRERGMVSRVATVLPGVRDTLAEARFRENARLEAGMDQYDGVTVRETVHESAVDRMVDILDLMRFVVGGRAGSDARRMKRCVIARAAGLSIEQCGRVWDKYRVNFDRRTMHDIKSRVLGQMLKGIETEFGLVRTSRGFRRLTVREIEAQAKARKKREAEDAGL